MKLKKLLIPILTLSLTFSLFACGSKSSDATTTTNNNDPITFNGDYDNLGGGKEGTIPTSSSVDSSEIEDVISNLTKETEASYDLSQATPITSGGSITTGGLYLITGNIDLTETISFTKKATDIHLIIKDANITITDDKAISSKNDLTITFVGTNTITNSLGTNSSDENLIKCGGNLTINGSGTVTLNSTKAGLKVDGLCNLFGSTININSLGSAINASRIYVDGSNINIDSEKDGLHAEIDYDEVDDASSVVYTNSDGFIYVKSGNITIDSADDGFQADTFIVIDGGTINITTNNGAPTKITEQSSDNADGKGLKAGYIDYTLATDPDTDLELEVDNHAIIINGGTISINSNDDAVHSNGYFVINGGTLTISSGDDGLHAETLGIMNSGSVTVNKSYEGYEAAKVEINGGTLNITSTDDGINAADGTETRMGVGNTNCYMIINGGTITVNASGDGLDSNNSILITGGTIYVDGPTNGGNGSLDSETGIIINGGELIATGALGMVETPASNSKNYSINYTSSTTLSSNTYVKLVDEDNNTVIDYTTIKTGQSIIISSSKLVKGKTYKLYINNTLKESITINSTITTAGASQNSFNNRPGGMRP